MMMFSSILFKSLTFTQPKASCVSKLSADGKEYQFCHKAKELSSYTLGQTLNLNNAGSSVFLYTEAVQSSNLTVQFSQATTFAVFGLQVESQKITGTTINVTIDFSIVTGALVCLQCNLSVDSSTLVFTASGQKLSGIMTTAGLFFQVSKSLLQFRLDGLYQSGLVNSIQREMAAFALQDSRMTCYFYNDGDQTGNLVVEVGAKTVLLASGFSICSNGIKDIASASDPAFWTVSGSISQNCLTICESGFVTYGLCLMNLLNGVQSNGQASCQNNFEFDGKDCVCEAGYVLNGSVCVDLVGYLQNLTLNTTNANQYLVTTYNSLDLQLSQTINKLQSEISGNQSALMTNLTNVITSINNSIDSYVNQTQAYISGNASQIDSYLAGNISQLKLLLQYNQSNLSAYVKTTENNLLTTLAANFDQLNTYLDNNVSSVNSKLHTLSYNNNNTIDDIVSDSTNAIENNYDSQLNDILEVECNIGQCKTVKANGVQNFCSNSARVTAACSAQSGNYNNVKSGTCYDYYNSTSSKYMYVVYCCRDQGYWSGSSCKYPPF
ncbi:Hypothetical_protein [Hexamita inflata]|uniref:Hypothetical_protein n=1 Tax=Hexamita inflata TaxID=28002 RepID=A0AA86V5R9_9EUKA|nr:Hypothetical protein HINF_LOCUS64982 [Hexamita inflata]